MIKTFIGMAAFVVVATATPAAAADYNLGTLSALSVNTKIVASGPISDNYFFSLAMGDLAGDIANFRLQFPGMNAIYNISGLTGSLFTVGGQQIGSFSGASSFTGLMGGDYRVNVSGIADGSLGGVYTLTLLPEAAVPVPGPGAYLVSGLGVLALGMRSRSRRKRIGKMNLATA